MVHTARAPSGAGNEDGPRPGGDGTSPRRSTDDDRPRLLSSVDVLDAAIWQAVVMPIRCPR